ncbi:transposase [Pseudomonas sp. LJDD11]|nr:transposase [Pseudomonas sp. LJDD11]
MAREVNQVWNYCNETSHRAIRERHQWLTTQTCSCCGSISTSSPKGRAGLRIREWTCVCCGTAHDRDVNAARNILAAGHRRLAVGIPAL